MGQPRAWVPAWMGRRSAQRRPEVEPQLPPVPRRRRCRGTDRARPMWTRGRSARANAPGGRDGEDDDSRSCVSVCVDSKTIGACTARTRSGRAGSGHSDCFLLGQGSVTFTDYAHPWRAEWKTMAESGRDWALKAPRHSRPRNVTKPGRVERTHRHSRRPAPESHVANWRQRRKGAFTGVRSAQYRLELSMAGAGRSRNPPAPLSSGSST